MTWRLESDGPRTGAWNMRRDEALATALAEGRGGPVLRLYQWNPQAVSLGWHQPEADIEAHLASERGIDVVRRPTGGRAILHADELTYCVVCPAEGRSLPAVYGAVNAALLRALWHLGIRASLEDSTPDLAGHYRTAGSAVCFSSTARNEVKVDGRKLIGSAQRRYASACGDDVVLQHGSILLGHGHEGIVDLLAGPSDRSRDQLRRSLRERTITLAEVRPGTTVESVADAVRRGFEETWRVTFRMMEPKTAEEFA